MRSFGGEALTQAAWQLAGLPPLLPCPALTGTELSPHAALHTLHQHSTTQDTASTETLVIPQQVQSSTVSADPRQRQVGSIDSRPEGDTASGTDQAQSDAAVAMQRHNAAECDSGGQDSACVGLGGRDTGSGPPQDKARVGPDWVQRPLGPDSVPLQEPQLVCIVQGMRLLVTLLRERHTWDPVSSCHSIHLLPQQYKCVGAQTYVIRLPTSCCCT